jgi:hypothetical protein
MVVTATNIKTPALPQQIDINGTAIATPAGASGIVGKLNGQDFFVVRNGQTISLQSGDWLTDGDRVVTSSAAEQIVYFAGNMPNTLNKVVFARGADFRIKGGEVYTTSMITMSLVAARDGLVNDTASVVGADEALTASTEESMATAQEMASSGSSNGLFGGALAGTGGTALGIGGATLAVLGISGGNDPAATQDSTASTGANKSNNAGSNDTGNTGGDTTDNPEAGGEAASGNFGGGAQQLADTLPFEMAGEMGANFESMLVEWGGMLDAASPAGANSILPGVDQASVESNLTALADLIATSSDGNPISTNNSPTDSVAVTPAGASMANGVAG